MKLEAFEHNLRNKTVPFAQSVVTSSGYHVPVIFTYSKNGTEKMSDLSSLFRQENKDVLFKVLGKYLEDLDACAYVLICEAFMKKVKKDEYDKLTEEDITNIKDAVDTSECLTITWEYKNEVTRSGIVSTPLLKDTGTIELDYENIVDDYDDKSQAEGRAVHLL